MAASGNWRQRAASSVPAGRQLPLFAALCRLLSRIAVGCRVGVVSSHPVLRIMARPDRSPVPGAALLHPRRHRPPRPRHPSTNDPALHRLAQPPRSQQTTCRAGDRSAGQRDADGASWAMITLAAMSRGWVATMIDASTLPSASQTRSLAAEPCIRTLSTLLAKRSVNSAEPGRGIEPLTYALQERCSAS